LDLAKFDDFLASGWLNSYNFFMYSFNRLEKFDLITIGTRQYSGGSFSVDYRTANGEVQAPCSTTPEMIR
jgi:hypothetical protein